MLNSCCHCQLFWEDWEIEALLTRSHKGASESQETRSNTELPWACSAADGGCQPFLTQNAFLNPKGKQSFVWYKLGIITFTVDKALGYLRASLCSFCMGLDFRTAVKGYCIYHNQDINSGHLWKGVCKYDGNGEEWVLEWNSESYLCELSYILPHLFLLVWLLRGSPWTF